MYATKPLSIFRSQAEASSQLPPEDSSSAACHLVVKEDEPDVETTCCWGFCKDTRVRDLPFPQNKILTVSYSEQQGENRRHYTAVAYFIPVLDKPLSSNQYYVVVAKGRKKGKVYTCSTEEEMTTCCFCRCINDVQPKVFDDRDVYQRMEIISHKGRFTAKSVASDGFPPTIFRKKYWKLHASQPKDYNLGEAAGLNDALRSRLPELDFPISSIGKWYCPFVFVKEARSLKEQMSKATFYEVSLDRSWEEVYVLENFHGDAKVVQMKATTRSKRVLLDGQEAVQEGQADGFVWFKNVMGSNGERVGLSLVVWERMRWEESRAGWVESDEVVEKVEEYGGSNLWKKYRCYVLMERFVFKRMDGSYALTFEFRHNNKVRTKWD
ncbi:uncharacterized protein [Typha angustifolia]|uniref:uncharacterized protein n=1 Tax=Typha angustifolia TaxID=59011 RepID=UPI003C2DBA45